MHRIAQRSLRDWGDVNAQVVALPRSDLFLDGAVAPLEDLRANGVRGYIGTNNVRNAFTPVGWPSLPSAAAESRAGAAARIEAGSALGRGEPLAVGSRER